MTAPTTPASPAKIYVLAEGAKFGIPVLPAEAGIATKEDLKIAATNPDGSANRLKVGPSGFYVEVKDVFCE